MSAFSKALAKSKLNQQRKRRTEAPSVTVGVSDNELNRLTNILQENIIGKTKRGSTPRRTIEIAFRNIDVDRSDAISFNEFKRAVDPYLQGVKERIIKALFEYFDVDGNEELTVNEFCGRLLKEDGFNNNNNNNSNSTQRKRLTESRQAKMIFLAPASFNMVIALFAELPVASMGSITTAKPSLIFSGNLI